MPRLFNIEVQKTILLPRYIQHTRTLQKLQKNLKNADRVLTLGIILKMPYHENP